MNISQAQGRIMNINDFSNVGEDIASSVNNSIKSGDFSHLSSDIGDITRRFSNQIVDEVKGTPDKHAYGEPIHEYGKTAYTYDNQRRYEHNQRRYEHEQDNGCNGNGQGAQNINSGDSGSMNGFGMNTQNGSSVYASDYRNHFPTTFNMNKVHHGTGVAELICGIMGSAVFGIAFAAMLISSIVVAGSAAIMIGAAATGSFLVMSIAGIVRGSGHTAISSNAREMARMIGARTYVPIAELSRRSGKTHDQVVKELKKLISKGIIPQGKFDENQTTLMLTDDMYKQYQTAVDERDRAENEKNARDDEQKKNYENLTSDVRSIIDEGKSYIVQIHEFNDRIPDETMSAKLSQLEDIMKRIFEQVEKKPSSADELHKLMNYYLPTTTKLIKAYIDVSEQPIEGQNIAETKHQIEDSLDVINKAFEKLLDGMFEDMNWDIRSDINVMKTMMAQDGLTNSDDFNGSKTDLKNSES